MVHNEVVVAVAAAAIALHRAAGDETSNESFQHTPLLLHLAGAGPARCMTDSLVLRMDQRYSADTPAATVVDWDRQAQRVCAIEWRTVEEGLLRVLAGDNQPELLHYCSSTLQTAHGVQGLAEAAVKEA